MRYRRETKPRKRIPWYDEEINVIAETLCEMSGNTIPSDVRIYCVNQRRGYWTPSKRYITIPDWVILKSKGEDGYKYAKGYDIYYIAHELAHMVVTEIMKAYKVRFGHYPNYAPHGKEFMREFKKLCPKEYWHYEIDYKPRNAKMAGISEKKC